MHASVNSSVETKQETLLLQGWVREMAANCSHKSTQQERERDGAAAGRTTQSNSYQRSWTAGWRSWSSASAPSGRLPRGWTDSGRVLLGHLLGNKALVTPQPSQHLACCLGLILGHQIKESASLLAKPVVQASTAPTSTLEIGKTTKRFSVKL